MLGVAALSAQAADTVAFQENFNDSTLRVDYIFGGGPDGVRILLDSQSKTEGWYGRRKNLDTLPLQGNGQIEAIDPSTGKVIYKTSFSSLFQEWLVTDEAATTNRAYENSFLLPLPKNAADIRVTLLDNRHQPVATLTHRYDPANELVAVPKPTPNRYEYIHKGGDPKDVIDVAILAEGYTPDEMDSFLEHARETVATIFGYEPFGSMRDKFNFIAIMSPSKDSGVSIPLKGEWKDTAFGSHFSTFHSPRYLTAPDVKAMHDAMTGLPYEHIIILANTENYGGGGIYNSYTLSAARNAKAKPVVTHEFGHSFGGLADEYFYADQENDTYPLDIEPWEQNITTMVDFDSKWKSMVKPGTPIPTPWKADNLSREERVKQNDAKVAAREAQKKNKKKGAKEQPLQEVVGVYEGGSYRSKGVYRPVETCRMRDNYHPKFCPVCEDAITRVINFYVN